MTAVDETRHATAVPVPPEALRAVFRGHPAGVAVVTTVHEGRHVGFTATSVISVSADPPVVAFSLAATSSSWPALATARTVAVSLLGAHQADLSARFATSGIDRFADGGWVPLPSGEAVVDGAAGWVHGRVLDRVVAGSSRIVTVEVLAHHVRDDVAPLVFHDRGYRALGARV
ncbi:flavin reductase (DIM6/NTAB) family NADH-FMN oxidoreductase RutF [Sediminihabitans luteus]|uniref:Flavin reductase (DIM6/NTAB) family NADH-FMN oxidoreductase RutF n=1 Tax=Sediminihabitans luteus TaxID=1138585 RepID=A0A2M9D0H5_9CELL|nr:flavin reductase family protein [Sediminihabitans luteus]PJJ77692.1 flavin reductase (DIM6/NTAB) family NADH-FMN oxidoreductase RutF [Sediminihabitans luteus]GIJ00081.1 flavin-dependent reductase [Sediminihabitans luteus]